MSETALVSEPKRKYQFSAGTRKARGWDRLWTVNGRKVWINSVFDYVASVGDAIEDLYPPTHRQLVVFIVDFQIPASDRVATLKIVEPNELTETIMQSGMVAIHAIGKDPE